MKFRVHYWTCSDAKAHMDVDALNDVDAVYKVMQIDDVFCQLNYVEQVEEESQKSEVEG
jgi:hypothetical protein